MHSSSLQFLRLTAMDMRLQPVQWRRKLPAAAVTLFTLLYTDPGAGFILTPATSGV